MAETTLTPPVDVWDAHYTLDTSNPEVAEFLAKADGLRMDQRGLLRQRRVKLYLHRDMRESVAAEVHCQDTDGKRLTAVVCGLSALPSGVVYMFDDSLRVREYWISHAREGNRKEDASREVKVLQLEA